MSGLRQRINTFDKSVLPEARDAQSQKQFGFICRQEKKIANAASSATAPPHPLEKAGDRWWRADLHYTVKIADVDPELQRRRCHDHAVRLGRKRCFSLAALVGRQRTVGDERLNTRPAQT